MIKCPNPTEISIILSVNFLDLPYVKSLLGRLTDVQIPAVLFFLITALTVLYQIFFYCRMVDPLMASYTDLIDFWLLSVIKT